MRIKKKVYFALNQNSTVSLIIQTIIVTNLILVMLESIEAVQSKYGLYLLIFDRASVLVFTIEYICRVWVSDYNTSNPIKARLKFIFSFMGLIDLLAILPFFITVVNTVDFRSLRVIRIVRLLRIMKIARYSKALNAIQ